MKALWSFITTIYLAALASYAPKTKTLNTLSLFIFEIIFAIDFMLSSIDPKDHATQFHPSSDCISIKSLQSLKIFFEDSKLKIYEIRLFSKSGSKMGFS